MNVVSDMVIGSVLLVEDDPMLSDALVRSLRDFGCLAVAAPTAFDALKTISRDPPDIIVLDLGLPDLDGGEALRMIRGVSDVPVIVATARKDELRVVQLLHAGADDYLVKPFTVEHLLARMTAVLRRTRRQHLRALTVLSAGELRIDLDLRDVRLGGRRIDLNRKEFDLLAFLAQQQGRVVARRELVEAVWGRMHSGADSSVDVHMSWLRRKLGESAAEPRYLHTVRGVGFRLAAPT